jgi:hypothetical protein
MYLAVYISKAAHLNSISAELKFVDGYHQRIVLLEAPTQEKLQEQVFKTVPYAVRGACKMYMTYNVNDRVHTFVKQMKSKLSNQKGWYINLQEKGYKQPQLTL